MYVGRLSGLLASARRVFKGPADGQLRCELDDSQSFVRHGPRVLNRLGRREIELPLHELLHHPRFFAAYPDTATLPLRFDPTTRDCEIEHDNGTPKHITLGVAQDLRYTDETEPPATHHDVLHELQHVVQLKEGFSMGASLVNEEVRTRMIHLRRMAKLMNNNPAHDDALYVRIDEIRTGTSPLEAAIRRRTSTRYHFSAGEIEARDTEARTHWNEQQRLNTPSVLENLAQLPVRTILRHHPAPLYRSSGRATAALSAHIEPARRYDR